MSHKWNWDTLFADIDLDAIEDMWAEGYDVDRIYEEFFPFFRSMIEDGELTEHELYQCIRDYINDMDWKECG